MFNDYMRLKAQGYRYLDPGDAKYGPWYEPPKETTEPDKQKAHRAQSLCQYALDLERSQAEVHKLNMLYARFYSNRELGSFAWGNQNLTSLSLKPVDMIVDNVTRQLVDVYVSQVTRNDIKPAVIARGGSWALRRQAEGMEAIIYAHMKESNVWAKSREAYKHQCIFGLGALRFDIEGDSIKTTVVHPDDILVDQAETVLTGDYSYIIQRKAAPMRQLEQKYKVDLSKVSTLRLSTGVGYRSCGPGWVVTHEAWLRKTPESPGRHIIAVGDVLVVDEAWDHEWLPFVLMRFPDAARGLYSSGIVERLMPKQLKVVEIDEVFSKSMRLFGNPWVLMPGDPAANAVKVRPLTNTPGQVIYHTPGMAPQVQVHQLINPQLFGERDRLIQSMMADLGITLTTTGQLPQGSRLDSSVALREAASIQTDRLILEMNAYQDAMVEVGKMIIRLLGTGKVKPEMKVWDKSLGGYGVGIMMDWDAMEIDADDYALTMEAATTANMQPAALRDELERDLANGVISPEQYRVERAGRAVRGYMTLGEAAFEYRMFLLSQLRKGIRMEVNPAQDIAVDMKYVAVERLLIEQYRTPDIPEEDRCPDEVMRAMDDFLQDAARELKKLEDEAKAQEQEALAMQQQAMGQPTMPPGAEGMMPGMPQPEGMPNVG